MPVASGAVRIEGLREFQAALRRMDGKLPRELRLVLNEAGQIVVRTAEPMVPHRSGAAAASIKMASSQREARIKAGSARVPYYGWLDFGGAVGRNRSVKRPFIKQGRYLYPAFRRNEGQVLAEMQDGLTRLARSSGVGVD